MIRQSAVKDNLISGADEIFLKSILKNRDNDDRLAQYHIYLAKKYLWNNYKPKLARKNLLLSFKIDYSFWFFVLFMLTFFPENIVQKLYFGLKKSASH